MAAQSGGKGRLEALELRDDLGVASGELLLDDCDGSPEDA